MEWQGFHSCALGRNRTSGLADRSGALCPAELRGLAAWSRQILGDILCAMYRRGAMTREWCGERESNPHVPKDTET